MIYTLRVAFQFRGARYTAPNANMDIHVHTCMCVGVWSICEFARAFLHDRAEWSFLRLQRSFARCTSNYPKCSSVCRYPAAMGDDSDRVGRGGRGRGSVLITLSVYRIRRKLISAVTTSLRLFPNIVHTHGLLCTHRKNGGCFRDQR